MRTFYYNLTEFVHADAAEPYHATFIVTMNFSHALPRLRESPPALHRGEGQASTVSHDQLRRDLFCNCIHRDETAMTAAPGFVQHFQDVSSPEDLSIRGCSTAACMPVAAGMHSYCHRDVSCSGSSSRNDLGWLAACLQATGKQEQICTSPPQAKMQGMCYVWRLSHGW